MIRSVRLIIPNLSRFRGISLSRGDTQHVIRHWSNPKSPQLPACIRSVSGNRGAILQGSAENSAKVIISYKRVPLLCLQTQEVSFSLWFPLPFAFPSTLPNPSFLPLLSPISLSLSLTRPSLSLFLYVFLVSLRTPSPPRRAKKRPRVSPCRFSPLSPTTRPLRFKSSFGMVVGGGGGDGEERTWTLHGMGTRARRRCPTAKWKEGPRVSAKFVLRNLSKVPREEPFVKRLGLIFLIRFIGLIRVKFRISGLYEHPPDLTSRYYIIFFSTAD